MNKKGNKISTEMSLQAYENKQSEIIRLLKQIEDGIEKHDRKASSNGGHHWGYVGDLTKIAADLTEIRDFLHGKSEHKNEVDR